MAESKIKSKHEPKVTKGTPAKKEVFLLALLEHGCISHACEAIKISRTSIYRWKDQDDQFAVDCEATLKKSLFDRLYAGTISNHNPATLIFMGKAILGLSDSAGEAVQLRKQLNETMRELESLRLAVYQATKSNPVLQGEIFEAVDHAAKRHTASN